MSPSSTDKISSLPESWKSEKVKIFIERMKEMGISPLHSSNWRIGVTSILIPSNKINILKKSLHMISKEKSNRSLNKSENINILTMSPIPYNKERSLIINQSIEMNSSILKRRIVNSTPIKNKSIPSLPPNPNKKIKLNENEVNNKENIINISNKSNTAIKANILKNKEIEGNNYNTPITTGSSRKIKFDENPIIRKSPRLQQKALEKKPIVNSNNTIMQIKKANEKSELNKYKIFELHTYLIENNLPINGRKKELIERIWEKINQSFNFSSSLVFNSNTVTSCSLDDSFQINDNFIAKSNLELQLSMQSPIKSASRGEINLNKSKRY